MKKEIYYFAFSILSIFLQGCEEENYPPIGMPKKSKDRVPQVCVEESGHNTYVINKNSVYAKKEVSQTEKPNYTGLPLKPAHLLFLDTSGYLQNSTFRVRSYKEPQVRIDKCPLKFPYPSDQGVALSQIMSYYYSSLAMGFSKNMDLYLKGQKVYIVTSSPITGWASQDNTIYLGITPKTKHDSGLDASILLNLISEANIYHGTRGNIYEDMALHHRDCRGEREMCCKTELGCSKAISIGLSLYFSSYFFQDAPTMGETYSNKITGMEDCKISRDLNQNRNLQISNAFNACDESGYVYPMATLYASIWWSVFQEISKNLPEKHDQLQVLYLKHIKEIKGNFTFEDSFNEIKSLDSKHFEFSFSKYFIHEFKKRAFSFQL